MLVWTPPDEKKGKKNTEEVNKPEGGGRGSLAYVHLVEARPGMAICVCMSHPRGIKYAQLCVSNIESGRWSLSPFSREEDDSGRPANGGRHAPLLRGKYAT